MRVLCVCVLVVLGAPTALAQRGASGPVAELNAEARLLHETDPERSLEVAERALVAARAARDVRGEAEALNYVAFAHRQHSRLAQARQLAIESARLFAQAGDPYGESQGYNTLGLIEADAGRFADALEYHLKALAIRQRTDDREGLAYTFNNLGNVYRNMAQYEQSLDYHQRALALKVELGMRESEAYSHHNIGLVHFAMGDYLAAGNAYRRGLEIRQSLDDIRGMAVSLNAIGSVELQTNPAGALKTFTQALQLRRQAGDERGEMATELNLGDAHHRLKAPGAAASAYRRALAIGDRIDAPLMRSAALQGLAESEAARGDYRAAYEHHRQYVAKRDAIFNREAAARIQQLQVEHETEQQQQQVIAVQQAELARERTMRTAVVVIAILVVLSLALLYLRLRLKHQSETRLRLQAEELAQALDRVQTLKGLLPICASCKKIRDDNGYWTQVEQYVAEHSAAEFTHSICPTCFSGLYPQGGDYPVQQES
jgi:tetratricopeptide (TPR) repeat protein